MNKKNNEWWLKFGSVTLIIFGWVLFFWWKSQNAEKEAGTFLVILGVITVVGLILLFGKGILKNFAKKDEGIPEPLSPEEVEQIIIKEAKDKVMNNILIEKPYEWEKIKSINDNIIYAKKVRCNLDNEKFIIIINATYYPKIAPSIYPEYRMNEKGDKVYFDKDDYYIDKWMNDCSKNPFEEPDVKKTKVSLDPFNRPVEETEEITHKEKKKEEEPVA